MTLNTSQVSYYMTQRKKGITQHISAMKAGISVRSGRRIEKGEWAKNSVRHWRTRKDPLEAVWDSMLVPLLKERPALTPTTLLEMLQDTRVNDRVSSLVSDTARLAHYSADTREQLLTLADQVHHKLNHLEEKLHRVDQVQRAQLHLEQIFSWWSAGRYASFSPAGRCYVALEELRWGAFGDVIRQSETGQVNQLLDILRHKALTQMAQESGGSATVRLNTLDWLGGQGREQADNEWHDAINWLGDWCSEEQHPVIWSTTQAAEHLPVRMPRLCSAERLSESMVDEIFQKGAA
nr:diguanylate cyclase regulator RdcB family protein [Escherichia coli]